MSYKVQFPMIQQTQTPTGDINYLLELFNQRDSQIEQRIQSGIQEHRKKDATLCFVDAQGQPAKQVQVKIELKRHAFGFGANCFMLNGYDSTEMNQA